MSSFLISRDTVIIDNAAPDRVASLPTDISRVALHGINDTVFTFLHNAYMVSHLFSGLMVYCDIRISSCYRGFCLYDVSVTVILSVTCVSVFVIHYNLLYRYFKFLHRGFYDFKYQLVNAVRISALLYKLIFQLHKALQQD